MELDPSKIKLVVGLGNPGKKYTNTRHNAGFMFVDALRAKYKGEAWQDSSKTETQLSKVELVSRAGEQVTWRLAQPQTFMNESGRALQKLCSYYDIKPEEVLIAYDDLDIPLGKFKIRFDNSPQVHNGLRSIENYLPNKKFWHLRLGIDAREVKGNKGIPGMRYALERFTAEQQKAIDDMFKNIFIQLFKS